MTQMELDSQLGGIYSLLTTEFLVPYLNRKLAVAQKTGEIPRLPKGIVNPVIVAGVNALGRGQDRESLGMFLTTISQTMGPQATQQFINPEEVIRRLAVAQGITTLNLVKSKEDVEAAKAKALSEQADMEVTKQTGQILSAPMNDPSKNPELNPNNPNGISSPPADQEGPPPQEG